MFVINVRTVQKRIYNNMLYKSIDCERGISCIKRLEVHKSRTELGLAPSCFYEYVYLTKYIGVSFIKDTVTYLLFFNIRNIGVLGYEILDFFNHKLFEYCFF